MKTRTAFTTTARFCLLVGFLLVFACVPRAQEKKTPTSSGPSAQTTLIAEIQDCKVQVSKDRKSLLDSKGTKVGKLLTISKRAKRDQLIFNDPNLVFEGCGPGGHQVCQHISVCHLCRNPITKQVENLCYCSKVGCERPN